jgi:hypothetical protein
MPNRVDGVLVHIMFGTELSRVRTELHRWRILTAIPPHPVQADPQPAPSLPWRCTCAGASPGACIDVASLGCYALPLGPLPPTRNAATNCLACRCDPITVWVHGVLTGDHSHVGADLLAAMESFRSSNDQDVGKGRKWAHARMRHQPQRLGPFSGFLLRGCG